MSGEHSQSKLRLQRIIAIEHALVQIIRGHEWTTALFTGEVHSKVRCFANAPEAGIGFSTES